MLWKHFIEVPVHKDPHCLKICFGGTGRPFKESTVYVFPRYIGIVQGTELDRSIGIRLL